MRMEAFDFWPTRLYEFKTKDIDNQKIKQTILEQEKKNPSVKISNRGGYHSNVNSIFNDNLSEPKEFIEYCMKTICKKEYDNSIKFNLEDGWFNINRKNHSNDFHVHPHCSWSAVYYVTPTDKTGIVFRDPRLRKDMDDCESFRVGNDKHTGALAVRDIKEGTVIFFPSWLEHGVEQNLTDKVRISIACNFSRML